jgi:hypothetical protein
MTDDSMGELKYHVSRIETLIVDGILDRATKRCGLFRMPLVQSEKPVEFTEIKLRTD